jgi:heat shock 70kDa protein 4
LDLDENPKAKLRLMEAIENARKVLSANTDAGINLEFLMEEKDFNTNVNRDDLFTLGKESF